MRFYGRVFPQAKEEKGFYLFNPRITWAELFFTALGTGLAISVLALFHNHLEIILLIPPFGASAVLLFAAPTVALAQPRNAIGGHIISAFFGVSCYQFFGLTWWSMTLAVTLSILAMSMTDTLHPPGGSTTLVAMFSHASWSFILFPVAIGISFMILVAIIVNRFSEERTYPMRKR